MKINSITSPATWCWVIATFLLLIYTAKLIALIGPPVVIAMIADVDSNVSLADLQFGLTKSVEEFSKTFDMSISAARILLIYKAFVSACFVILTPFLAIKRNWARIGVLILLFFEIAVAAAPLRFNIEILFNLVIYLGIAIVLVMPSVKYIYERVPHNKSPS